MHKVGVFAGKFLPPHRGHLAQIINASTQCERLYVVVSHNNDTITEICKNAGLQMMPLAMRARWLSIELQGFDHIKVKQLDESAIPVYPNGWQQWSNLVRNVVKEKIDVIFGGELEYKENMNKYFPEAEYKLFDYNRTRYPISATMVRENPMQHWDYILGSARPFFAKKVLITGTESCGKSTITKYLAKLYHTSWSEEVGRFYAGKYMGGNEETYTNDDFERIAAQQYEADMDALRHANRVVFYDTDATVTDYYQWLYTATSSEKVISYICPERYDLVLFFEPDVKWVDDGQRFNGGDEERYVLSNTLYRMYDDHDFMNIRRISGNYTERLNKAIEEVDKLLFK